jgi:hypothetical protein
MLFGGSVNYDPSAASLPPRTRVQVMLNNITRTQRDLTRMQGELREFLTAHPELERLVCDTFVKPRLVVVDNDQFKKPPARVETAPAPTRRLRGDDEDGRPTARRYDEDGRPIISRREADGDETPRRRRYRANDDDGPEANKTKRTRVAGGSRENMPSKKQRRTFPKRRQAEPIEPEDSSILTDADWATLNELSRMYGRRPKELKRAFVKLAVENPECYSRLLAAFYPTKTREAVLDAAAALGLDDDDIRQIIRDIESPSKKSN